MTYDLEVINHAWYIACDDCVNAGVTERLGNELMFRHILDYCSLHALSLLRQAKIELDERNDKALIARPE